MTTYEHAPTYPVHVDARLDPQLSRGLWLVKWLLGIPHYVVLTFLWMAFVVLSMVAFFAILLTGRYPRAIFDFNVGVMRWSWRVAYYAYGALGTDRYPPFSLQEEPDYPAHLDVEYPEHLSRGLVLVKWWLLAIPHYLIVGVLVSGGIHLARATDTGAGSWISNGGPWTGGGGLIGLLTVIAAVVLLFTGSYPRQMFDLILGLNRWVIRVAAYASLMTDEYPPFRLDQGGDDPDTGVRPSPPVASPAHGAAADGPATGPAEGHRAGSGPAERRGAAPQPGTSHWSAGRVLSAVGGSVAFLLAIGLLVGGSAAAVADTAMRDGSGYLTSDAARHLTTDTYALTSRNLQVHAAGAMRSMPHRMLGDVKVTATSQNGKPLFVGLARTEDAAALLKRVGHAMMLGGWATPRYSVSQGSAPRAMPGQSHIWVVRAAGTGPQSVVAPVANGDWTVVVMNADGSRGVDTTLTAGLTAPGFGTLATVLLVVGGALLVLSVIFLVVTVRGAQRPSPAR